MDVAETIAIITTEGWFTSKPSLSGVEDIIGYVIARDAYLKPEDADGDPVKRYAVVCRVTIEEIE
ncbi:hypothetical protein UX924_001033 [Salmonella enterica]|uniref:hypothetical protein n=1 Tax=Salmonella enterica TaxID=28901 RepID=UPI000FB060D6|nr:hypothetical protein [Salmonella enterica]EAA8256891.1 hypothetical protein [Salmonella enterica subsp. enterica]EBV5389343.1 hypothetical protein [Salmonella enterica subsp. enterica serovar Tananarive]EDB4177888.1 hypothetical protein [Salmonella enterica subsp. enterica serovar Poona]EEJ7600342.1 hypothetical protein [Salmonella enterica subsp. enterica serovar Kiambu]EAB6818975.1 hypothetical protein [Salmonella enterica subsp. enterica serovar Brunei]